MRNSSNDDVPKDHDNDTCVKPSDDASIFFSLGRKLQ